jgi:hypothetical protein
MLVANIERGFRSSVEPPIVRVAHRARRARRRDLPERRRGLALQRLDVDAASSRDLK